jgi:hypothetical protein
MRGDNSNGKRRSKISLFADDMIIYLKTPKKSIKKMTVRLINNFSKVAGYNVRKQKSVMRSEV